ncbi:hypothetical protein KIH31_12610 [Paenarthrobacter sp. DKR-5]|uniref:hypothetical protein n=1 Tax=Paenarthrobacter sp. DKR-5 TaxID=2835535 RepID=UPI001BDC4F02|nr:hypothetical protein [Paenarthrobacter sp. DKR-5]MBT1003446.1 hypothetical protein [Paenarthrobacter sp. DKR-5]
MAEAEGFASRFMKLTGKLRIFFGPAQQGSLEGPVIVRRDAAQLRREAELSQWETVRNPDGTTYLRERPAGQTS